MGAAGVGAPRRRGFAVALSLLASFFVIPVIFLLAWLLTVSTHPRLAATRLPKRPLPRHDNEGRRSEPKAEARHRSARSTHGHGTDSVDPFPQLSGSAQESAATIPTCADSFRRARRKAGVARLRSQQASRLPHCG